MKWTDNFEFEYTDEDIVDMVMNSKHGDIVGEDDDDDTGDVADDNYIMKKDLMN